MIQRPRRSLLSSSRAACAAASLAVGAMFWANPGDALAQASGVAPAATGQTYAVKPGQSLNDVVSELTGSKDRDVRAKAARALFDANPNAFGNHDINKLKLGAVLNVPADLIGSAASAAASAPEAQPNPPAESPAPAQASESTSAMASAAAPASAVEPQASATSTQEPATPEPASATATPASEPALAASAPASDSRPTGHGAGAAVIGLSPFVVAAAIAAVGFLLLRMRRGKKQRAAASNDDVDRTSRTFASLEEAQADAAARNEAIRKARDASAAGSAVAAEKKSSEPDGSGLAAAAASIDNADATRAPAVPSDDELPPTTEAKPATGPVAAPGQANRPAQEEAFAPVAPAARHPDFVPPVAAAETQDQHAREIAAREAARREAEKWENEEREAAARQEAVREAEEREIRAREAAAREALARESADREAGKREAELRQVTEREDQAREAAAREIIAREAELRELQARAAEEQVAEQRAAEQRDIEEQAAREAEKSGIAPDEEPVLAHRFPMPKFPQDAIQALGSLEMELPPRMELTIKPPGATEPVTVTSSVAADVQRESRPAALQPPPTGPQPIEQVPFIPQPMAQPESARPTQSQAQSVASQIEAGTAGAASVAGLGATRFGPLSLDFDLGRASSATEPLPALTPAQLATIARNKLELAAEYIELGDLSGARTLLQEVIESNDPATRQQAATLLSTLAPHS
ncbi:FimV/HubP family polar landmark protein [Caballeronia sp. LZ029]|uniref:FimV/HubP family polar landmark protein n=1 Tax=Caballeronia sp. LZ029 TaxID=3038564 RepID=UPI0028609748|nr:FimV/HubP family polar landmark protein [Caballeronia sp. LZ029]MDR5747923.1 FimV/HubP family polar landmark protein [Caballeronia sp. LZ029]